MASERSHIPGWKTGLASSICPKWPGHSDMPSPHVWHLKLRSIVPMRGSISPPILGLCVASSMTSGCSILATEMAFYCIVSFLFQFFLQNTYNFLRRENTKLYLLNFANWSRGKSELMTEHGELRLSSDANRDEKPEILKKKSVQRRITAYV